MTFCFATTLDELWSGEKMAVEIGRARVLLVNVGGEVRAYEDRCAHRGARLSDGKLQGTTLTCAAHEWVYDATTGKGINPCTVALRPVPVRIQGTDILVDVGFAEEAKPCAR